MSWADSLKSLTLGTLWSAATGTVDPWKKTDIIQQEQDGLIQASGGSISANDAYAIAYSDVTGTLQSANADPSQVQGFDLLFSAGDILFIALIAVVGYYVYVLIRARK